jgi:hypothetical protein
MKTDLYTYGNSPAAIVLAKLVDQYDVGHKVGRIWGDCSTGLREIGRSNLSQRSKKQMFCLWRDAYLNRTKRSNLPDEVQHYLNNVIVTRFKMWISDQINE